MRHLEEIKKTNEDAMRDIFLDQTKPALFRAKVWLGTDDASFFVANSLVCDLVTYCEQLADRIDRLVDSLEARNAADSD